MSSREEVEETESRYKDHRHRRAGRVVAAARPGQEAAPAAARAVAAADAAVAVLSRHLFFAEVACGLSCSRRVDGVRSTLILFPTASRALALLWNYPEQGLSSVQP